MCGGGNNGRVIGRSFSLDIRNSQRVCSLLLTGTILFDAVEPFPQIQPPLFLAREDAIELFPRNHPPTKILHRGVLVVLGALSSQEMPRR